MSEQHLLSSLLKIISGTPTWVWFVLGYLIFIGIRSTGTRIVYIPKLFVIPLVLSGLKYKVFMTNSISVWIGYLICLFLSSFLSYKHSAMRKIKIIKESMSVKLPGTYWTLIVLMGFFVVKYFFGYIRMTNPAYYNDIKIFELSINGIFSGYFLGKAICYLTKFKMEQT